MKLGIMQPYFLPYIGYFQLASAVDTFVVYDDIQYTKKGWIQRNRILVNNNPAIFSISLKKDSDYLDIRERELSSNYDRVKLCRQIQGAYQKAPYFKEVFPIIESIIRYEENNLYMYIFNSISIIFKLLKIESKVIHSSTLNISRDYKSQERVLLTCQQLNATEYINPPGGVDLYSKDAFINIGLNLKFLNPVIDIYPQSGSDFVSHLSIIDVLMWNGIVQTQKMVKNYGFL